jgi:hypothetical protein
MLNEDEIWYDSSLSINEAKAADIQALSPRRSLKFTTMLTTLETLTADYPINNAVNFLVETLFQQAVIKLHPLPTNCKLEPCGARGADFCTLFIDAPATAVDSLIEWLKHFLPALSAKSLNALTDEEKNTNNFTVISVTNEASITLNIDALIKNIYPLLDRSLTQDPNNVMKFDYLNKLNNIILMIKAENTTLIGDSNYLITLTRELYAHISEHGFENELHEL